MVLLPRPGNGSSSLIASAQNTIVPCPLYRRPHVPSSSLKGIFAGSGSASMSTPYMAQAVVGLTQRRPQDVSLLYIGTASYDITKFRDKQTNLFSKMGVNVESLNVANQHVPKEEVEEAVDRADIILVSGGNTLYAVDRWEYLGLDELLKGAAHRGKVMAGGSAGAICWFDGGHSDSGDPDTYRSPMLSEFGGNADPSSNPSSGMKGSDDNKAGISKDWEYIRVDGLGIWPGLICPHYDRIQSNGVLRMTDFDSMMKRHPHELGIGIDHHAALQVNGDEFRILSIPGQKGSVNVEDENGKRQVPGVWIKHVDDDGNVHSITCPESGKVAELLQMLEGSQKPSLLNDEKVDLCRKENPLLRD